MAGVSVDLELVLDQALAAVDALEARIVEATAAVSVEVDTSAAEAQIGGIEAPPVDVEVEADTTQAEDAIGSIPEPEPVEVPVSAPGLQETQESLSGLSDSTSAFAGSLLGASSAARALTAVGLAAFITDSIGEFAEADRVVAVAEQRLSSLGSSAVTSIGGIEALSSSIQAQAGVSDEAVTSAQTLLLTFGNLSDNTVTTRENFERATRAIFDISTVQGNAQSNAIALGKALEDPVAGLGRLGRAGITFTDQQKEVIAALVETGDIAGAQNLILTEIEDKYGGLAEAAGGSLAGGLDRAGEAFGEFQESVGEVAASSLPLVTGGLDALQVVLAVIGPIVRAFGRGLEGVGAALGLIPTPVLAIVAAFASLVVAARGAVTAMLLLQAASPVTLTLVGAAVAVTALGSALGLLDDQAQNSTTQLFLTAEALNRIQREAATLGQVLAESGQAGLVDAVLQRIIDISPALVDALNEAGTSVADIVSQIQGGVVPVDIFDPLVDASGLTGEAAEEARAALAALGLQIAQAPGNAENFAAAEGANADALGTTADAAALAQRRLDAMVSSVSGNLPTLGDAISQTSDQIAAFGGTMDASTDPNLVIGNLQAMVEAFANFGANLETLSATAGPLTVEALSGLGPEIAGTFTQALVDAPQAVRDRLELVLAAAQLAGADLTTVLTDTFGDAGQAGADALGNKRGAVGAAGRDLGTKAKEGAEAGARGLPDRIGGFADEAVTEARKRRPAARRAGDSLAQAIESGLTQGAPGVTNAARKLISTAASVLLSQRAQAYAAGQAVGVSMGQGMESGIASMVSGIAAQAAKAVDTAEAAARDAADANSPSRLFARLGRDMGDGLVAGLDDRVGAAAKASARLVAAPRVGAPLRHAGLGAAPFNVVVNVDARGARDPDAVAAAAQRGAESGAARALDARLSVRLRQP